MKNPLLTRSNQKTVQLLRFKTLPSDSFLDWNILNPSNAARTIILGYRPGSLFVGDKKELEFHAFFMSR